MKPYGKEYKKNRALIIGKQRGKCLYCDNEAKEVHHKDFNNLNDDESNLIALCNGCHLKVHGRTKKVKKEGPTTKVVLPFNGTFLKEVDNNWRNENFKSRSEYILYLVRNDLKKVQ